jgi:hypothetical protein
MAKIRAAVAKQKKGTVAVRGGGKKKGTGKRAIPAKFAKMFKSGILKEAMAYGKRSRGTSKPAAPKAEVPALTHAQSLNPFDDPNNFVEQNPRKKLPRVGEKGRAKLAERRKAQLREAYKKGVRDEFEEETSRKRADERDAVENTSGPRDPWGGFDDDWDL